jgi:hypothetical protein
MPVGYTVVAVIALYLCQAHTSALFLSTEADFSARPIIMAIKYFFFRMKRKGQETHTSLTIKKEIEEEIFDQEI